MSRVKNGSSTKIRVVWQKLDFLAKNWNFGPKKGGHFCTQKVSHWNPDMRVPKFLLPAPKKSPKMTFSPLIIWAKGPFFFEQLFSVVARTWLGAKSERLFLGPKFQFLAKKSDFCHTTPILVDDPFVALGEAVHFPTNDFPTSSFGVTPVFVKKKKRLTRQKVFALPTVGALSASNSPSAGWITVTWGIQTHH